MRRVALPALVLTLSVGGFVLASEANRRDREETEVRNAQVERVRAQAQLGRARAFVTGLSDLLADEPAPRKGGFGRLARGTTGGVGLPDAFWIESVPAPGRRAYERRIGSPITRLSPSGRLAPAPAAAQYLPATFVAGTTAAQPGVDGAAWRPLATAVGDRTSVFAVTATAPATVGDRPGYFLVKRSRFGRGPGSRGFLVVFVTRGWLTQSLQQDPSRFALSLEGQRLEGALDGQPGASVDFDALGRRWRVDVGPARTTGLQAALPWLALAWPPAVALVALLVARGVTRRRQAERDAERIFEMSLEMLCVAGTDGYFKRVNPAFERTLGYTADELLARPFADFVHPDDRPSTHEARAELAHGTEVQRFENRYIRKDGSICWLEWSSRPMPEEGLMYGAARDVTYRREAEAQLREAHKTIEASRDHLRVLAEEQAALKRVATLVARGASPTEVFDAVTIEVSQLLKADATRLLRYEPDGGATVLATWGDPVYVIPVGTRLSLEGVNVPAMVRSTRAAARLDSLNGAWGELAERLRQMDIHCAVGAPVVVDGRLWGVAVATWRRGPPGDAREVEARLAEFTELTAMAIANAENRSELAASRARIVAASDEARRRVERDLHDGTQQRLVSLALALRATEASIPPEDTELRSQLDAAARALAQAVEDLQEISRGLHPAILSKGGLQPALHGLARRSAVPVDLDVDISHRLSEPAEIAIYYVVSEALTNVAKHAFAPEVHVEVRRRAGGIDLTVSDEGVGGADPSRGSGLLGLRDRVEALGGTIEIESPIGAGTTLRVRIPVEAPAPLRS